MQRRWKLELYVGVYLADAMRSKLPRWKLFRREHGPDVNGGPRCHRAESHSPLISQPCMMHEVIKNNNITIDIDIDIVHRSNEQCRSCQRSPHVQKNDFGPCLRGSLLPPTLSSFKLTCFLVRFFGVPYCAPQQHQAIQSGPREAPLEPSRHSSHEPSNS
ncbi:hypothetical protein KC325_g256 [Hortaea werneckii]|nr:hypothetical protein KC325_g256 [Hortaea werneckii]